MIELSDRILLSTGESIVSDTAALEYLLENGELPTWMRVPNTTNSENYDYVYGTQHSISQIEEYDNEPVYPWTFSDWDDLILLLVNDSRVSNEKYKDRLIMELEFFEKNHLMPFIYNLYALIQRFKQDGVVWGVGRGSSCASFVLYLMDVHSVDPVKYNIDFSEFSKVKEYDE